MFVKKKKKTHVSQRKASREWLCDFPQEKLPETSKSDSTFCFLNAFLSGWRIGEQEKVNKEIELGVCFVKGSHLSRLRPYQTVTPKQIYRFHYRFQALLISSSSFTHSFLFPLLYLIPSLCSCCRMPRHPRARWWFWSAGSVEALLCRSDGTARERRSWTPPIFVFSKRVRHPSSSN